jgi:fructose-bisphosphate aldolase, class I
MGIINRNELESMAAALVSPGKGILAADECLRTTGQRFGEVGVEPTEETRRDYRAMLFETPNMQRFISGVILQEETLRQGPVDGGSFAEKLQRDGIIPGVSVDSGPSPLKGCPNEFISEGLDGLEIRLSEFKSLGARFAKWRSIFLIGESTPSANAIDANVHAAARFAASCQEAGLLPVIESDVQNVGGHSLQQSFQATADAIRRLFYHLFDYGVGLERMLFQSNMVTPGLECPQQSGPDEVAQWTLSCMRRVVPVAVPGILFGAGNQKPESATLCLNSINLMGRHPWELSFSFRGALSRPALEVWRGDPKNVRAAQQALYDRAKCNCAARYGKYSPDMAPKG